MNIAETLDGKYQALNSRKLHYWARTLGPIFRAVLAQQLKTLLGLQLHRPLRKDGTPESWFEVTGILSLLLEYWSSRRNELLDLLAGAAELGITSHPNSAAAKHWANLQTRQAKTAAPPLCELLEIWRNEAAELGFTQEHAKALLGKAAPVEDAEERFQEAWNVAVAKLTESQAYFTERHVIRAVVEELQATGVDGVWAAHQTIDRLERDPAIIPLDFEKREACYTTPKVWKLESELLSQVEVFANGWLNDRS